MVKKDVLDARPLAFKVQRTLSKATQLHPLSPMLKVLLLVAFLGESLALKMQNDVSPPQKIPMPNQLGELEVHEFGPKDGPLVLAIHGAKEVLKNEWKEIGKDLVLSGHRVIVPDFHSIGLRKSSDNIGPVLSKVLEWANAPSFSMLMGKSWGGKVAAHFAAANPLKVKKLVLAAPALNVEELQVFTLDSNIRTLILWAKDDTTVPFSHQDVLVESLVRNSVPVEVFNADSGGHTVNEAYVSAVAAFAKSEQAMWIKK